MTTPIEREDLAGRRVAYRPYPGAPLEHGRISTVTDAGAFVLFDGDHTAKLTQLRDLEVLG